jgi:hypothetical protein
MADPSKATQTPKADDPPDVKPRPFEEGRMQDRVRPLYDPVEIAKKYLDEMEAAGRLHHTNRK